MVKGSGGSRDKHRSSALCKKLDPFFVESKGNAVVLKSCAIGIHYIEGIVLTKPERKGIDTVATGSLPFLSAGIVTDAVDMAKACGKVGNTVASDYICLALGSIQNGFQEILVNLCRGFTSVIEPPVALGKMLLSEETGSASQHDGCWVCKGTDEISPSWRCCILSVCL